MYINCRAKYSNIEYQFETKEQFDAEVMRKLHNIERSMYNLDDYLSKQKKRDRTLWIAVIAIQVILTTILFICLK